jgi:hypothetical protein
MHDHNAEWCPAWINKEAQQPSDCRKFIHAQR